MKTQLKTNLVEIISLLYILLFGYAAISKLLDYKRFRLQLGQSPLLSPVAETIAWLVPAAELIIVLSLMTRKLRTAGFFGSYSMMVAFTAYIFIILHYSEFVPCSCGGILEKMGWQEHLWFNLFYICLSIIALFTLQSLNSIKP